jgi:hypothetical protein
MLAQLAQETGTHDDPAGWTKVGEEVNGSFRTAVYARVKQGGDSGNLTFTLGGGARSIGRIYLLPLTDLFGDVFEWDATALNNVKQSQSYNGSGVTVHGPGFTDYEGQTMALAFLGFDSGGTTGTFVSGGSPEPWSVIVQTAAGSAAGVAIALLGAYWSRVGHEGLNANCFTDPLVNTWNATLTNTGGWGVVAFLPQPKRVALQLYRFDFISVNVQEQVERLAFMALLNPSDGADKPAPLLVATGTFDGGIPTPTGGLAKYDIVIAHFVEGGATSTVPTKPSNEGWTLINSDMESAGTNLCAGLFWKRWGVNPTDDETPTFTGTGGTLHMAYTVWRHCKRTGSPIEANAIGHNTAQSTATAPTVTSGGARRTLLRHFGAQAAALSTPSEGTELFSGAGYFTTVGTDGGMAASYLRPAASGASGTATAAIGASTNWAAVSALLLPIDG